MTTVSAADVDLLDLTLRKIASDMNSIKEVLKDASSDGTFNHRCASIDLFASRAGSLADCMLAKVGVPQVRGNFEEWFAD